MIYFDSDYMEGAHPRVMAQLQATNLEHTCGYGLDHYSEEARNLIREACGFQGGVVQFLTGGTQTNATVIDALLRRHEGVLAAETSHINVHESGAVEHSGHKVLTLPAYDGKLKAEDVDRYIDDFYRDETYEHMVAPGLLYVTWPTEYGTIYSLDELLALSDVCRKHGIPMYIDGARMAYGLASPANDVSLKDIARLADVFYIGGTKCGLMFGEAVVARDADRLPHFLSLMKQHGALMAKGRLAGVQFRTLFEDGLYMQIGRDAIRHAMEIRDIFKTAGYKVVIDSPTNQQFFELPNQLIDRLKENVSFEYWGPRGETVSMVRFVASWATTDEDVAELAKQVAGSK